MRRKMLGTCFSLVALVALSITPAFAQAAPTLTNINNEAVGLGEKLTLSAGLGSFSIEAYEPMLCAEVQIELEVTENPGATAEIISSKFGTSSSNPLCRLNNWYNFDILDLDGSVEFLAEGKVAFDDWTLKLSYYLGKSEVGYCNYDVSGSGEVPGEGTQVTFPSMDYDYDTGTMCADRSGEARFYMFDENGESVRLIEN